MKKLTTLILASAIVGGLPASLSAEPTPEVKVEDVAGTYIFIGQLINNDNGTFPINFEFQITEPDADGNATIKNFFAGVYAETTSDLKAKVYTRVDDGDAATFVYLNGGQKILKYSGRQYYLYLYGKYSGDEGYYVYSDSEIEFYCNTGGLIGYYSDMGLMVGYKNDETYRGFYPVFGNADSTHDRSSVAARKVNATMTSLYKPTPDATATEKGYNLYAEYDEATNTLVTRGFGGYYLPVAWTVDPEARTATAVDQQAGYVDYNGDDLEVYLSDKNANDSRKVEATLSADPVTGKTVMHIASPVYLMGTPGCYGVYENAEIQLDMALVTAGIEEIGADRDNSDAPVVYYNLQGVRINYPAPGQVVIRRQGSDVTKIIVK